MMSEWEESPDRGVLIYVPKDVNVSGSEHGCGARGHQRILKAWSEGRFWYDGAVYESKWRIIAYTVCCNYVPYGCSPADREPEEWRTLLKLERHELYYDGGTQKPEWNWGDHAALFVNDISDCEDAAIRFRAIAAAAAPEVENRLKAIEANERTIRDAADVHNAQLNAVAWLLICKAISSPLS